MHRKLNVHQILKNAHVKYKMNYYLIIKSLHLIAVISWMVGLLYLPRIFVYHAENIKKNEVNKIFKIMEKRLYFYIMFPAMIASWFFGIVLILIIGLSSFNYLWLQLKLIFIFLLTIYHFYLGKCLYNFKIDFNQKSAKFFRMINEIPTLLLILIIFIVVLKPI